MYVKKHAPSRLRSLLDTLTRRTLFPDANQLVAKRHSSFLCENDDVENRRFRFGRVTFAKRRREHLHFTLFSREMEKGPKPPSPPFIWLKGIFYKGKRRVFKGE